MQKTPKPLIVLRLFSSFFHWTFVQPLWIIRLALTINLHTSQIIFRNIEKLSRCYKWLQSDFVSRNFTEHFLRFSSHEWTIGLAKVWGKIEQFMFSLTFLRLVFPIRPIAIIYISLSLSYNNQSKLVVHVCTLSENQWQSSKNSINAGWPAYPLNSCLDL